MRGVFLTLYSMEVKIEEFECDNLKSANSLSKQTVLSSFHTSLARNLMFSCDNRHGSRKSKVLSCNINLS